MCRIFSYLLVIGLTYTESAVVYPNVERNVCGKLIKNWEKFDCVVSTKCTSLNKLISSGQVEYCGDEDAATAKVCCPRSSNRVVRQAKAPTKNDPYSIAQQKCIEYADARYVTRTISSGTSKRTIRNLDCTKVQPLIHGVPVVHSKEFPHMALIGFTDGPDKSINETYWACGGTLISDRYVLTAAHCIKSGNFEARWVRLGELVLNDDSDSAEPKDFRILEKIQHPQYTSTSVYFDIMLLKLQKTVKFTPHMRPICLYTASVLSSTLNNQALITGWGATGADEQKSEALMKAQINFVNPGECTATYKADKKLSKGFDSAMMICAGDKEKGRDTCAGDSGGPLQVPVPDWTCMYSQVGITSYGAFICGQKNISSIYTKISPYIPWIQSIVWP